MNFQNNFWTSDTDSWIFISQKMIQLDGCLLYMKNTWTQFVYSKCFYCVYLYHKAFAGKKNFFIAMTNLFYVFVTFSKKLFRSVMSSFFFWWDDLFFRQQKPNQTITQSRIFDSVFSRTHLSLNTYFLDYLKFQIFIFDSNYFISFICLVKL